MCSFVFYLTKLHRNTEQVFYFSIAELSYLVRVEFICICSLFTVQVRRTACRVWSKCCRGRAGRGSGEAGSEPAESSVCDRPVVWCLWLQLGSTWREVCRFLLSPRLPHQVCRQDGGSAHHGTGRGRMDLLHLSAQVGCGKVPVIAEYLVAKE